MRSPFLPPRNAESWKEAIFMNLSRPDARLQPALLGAIVGVLTGLVMVAFRLLIEVTQEVALPGGSESYEQLHWTLRLLLPIYAGVIIGGLFTYLSGGNFTVGILYVLERLNYFQGQMHWRPMLLQFFGASIAIIGGHSVGREGPGVHLGAASGSLLAQKLKTPNNTVRLLVASGSAAAIAASFNTPLAGVIFAMEVVLMEYTVIGFLPIILASVTATAVSFAVFGNEPIFSVPPLSIQDLREIPLIMLLGLFVGLISVTMIKAMKGISARAKPWPYLARTSLAGLIVGLCALAYPQVMGIGYDTVNAALLGQMTQSLLLAILLFKVIATIAAIGLGIPGGIIGPTLVIGAALGSVVGYSAITLFPNISSNVGFYALLGMGAMMAATLQAPLAALVAILELTYNPAIVFPCMIAIVVAELTRSELFAQPPFFNTLLKARGLDYKANPLDQHLSRVGVATIMESKCVTVTPTLSLEQAQKALANKPGWLLIQESSTPTVALLAVDLARYLEESGLQEGEKLQLNDIPAQREQVEGIHLRATCLEADVQFRKTGINMLYVYDTPAPQIRRIKAVLTRKAVDSIYH